MDEGTFPANENEALVTNNAKNMLDLGIGEEIAITMPDGNKKHTRFQAFMNNAAKLMSEDSYGVFLTIRGFSSYLPK